MYSPPQSFLFHTELHRGRHRVSQSFLKVQKLILSKLLAIFFVNFVPFVVSFYYHKATKDNNRKEGITLNQVVFLCDFALWWELKIVASMTRFEQVQLQEKQDNYSLRSPRLYGEKIGLKKSDSLKGYRFVD